MAISFKKNISAMLLAALSFCSCVSSVTAQEPKAITNSIGMKLVLIPKGKLAKDSNTTEFIVPFYMGVHEVTQEQYYKVMGGNPSRFVGEKVAERDPFTNRVVNEGDSRFHPVENLNYNNAIEFCQKLSALPSERAAGRVYRLPSEEEWEYACRAGTTTTYSFGDSAVSLGDYAWYEANSNGRTHPVGQKKPNAWGLYDMHGNVSEWCIGEIDHPGSVFALDDDPRFRRNRGGSLYSDPKDSRSASRRISMDNFARPYTDIGFRIVWDFQRDVRMAELKKREQKREQEKMDAEKARLAQEDAINSQRTVVNSIGMKLREIDAGSFTMGSATKTYSPYMGDESEHQVTITKPYYIGVYEVTQGQYEKVMGKSDLVEELLPEVDQVVNNSSNHPVHGVSWNEAVEFCKRLSALPGEKQAGRVYRLPTEAEWEYACRAGSKTAYSFGESSKSLGDYAWYKANSNGRTHPVGQKKPNAWGLYDMHGNVWEWCADWFNDYPSGSVTDPTGPQSGSDRVGRGGSWFYAAKNCRSASRDGLFPSAPFLWQGFRVVCVRSGQ